MREEIEHRPLVVAALAFAIGLAAVQHLPLLLFWAALLWVVRPGGLKLSLSIAAFVGLLLAPPQPGQTLISPLFIRGEAHVLDLPMEQKDGKSTLLEIHSVRLFAFFTGSADVRMGDTLHVEDLAEPPTEAMDARAKVDRILGRIRLEPSQYSLVSRGPWPYQVGASWRASLLRLADKSLTPSDASMIGGMAFGATGLIDNERYEALRDTGTMHLVAASGLHVLVLAGILLAILGTLPIPRAVALALAAVVLVLYACAVGLHAAVIRAVIMAITGSAAYLFRREADALSALALGSIAVLLWRPESLYHPGFHLTIIVVAALVLFSRRTNELTFAGTIRGSAETALIATLASAPILALEFGYVPVIGLALNLVATVLLAPVIVLAMLAWATSFAWHDGGVLLMRSAGTLANGLGTLADWGGEQKWAGFAVPAFSPYWLILLYGLPLLMWRKRLRPA